MKYTLYENQLILWEWLFLDFFGILGWDVRNLFLIIQSKGSSSKSTTETLLKGI